LLDGELLLPLGLNGGDAMMGPALLWAMIVGMGFYQGLNPPMGWLPALARGLETGRTAPLIQRAAAIALGHYAAMLALLAPLAAGFAVLLPDPSPALAASGVLLLGFGLFKLWRPQHPRFIARIPPRQPVRWSFWMSATHCGSPLMMLSALINLIWLEPVYYGLRFGPGPRLSHDLGLAVLLAAGMTVPLLVTASGIALLFYRTLGLRLIGRLWFNLDFGWSLAFIAMGAMALAMGDPRLMAYCRSHLS